jgi:SpoIID/LytB domain protein
VSLRRPGVAPYARAMARRLGPLPFVALAAAAGALVVGAGADEMSGDDKLRLLYSHRFTFTARGLPLYTVEVMHGQSRVTVEAESAGGVRVLPDGEGGAEVVAGKSWTVTAEGARPAKVRWWTVVSRRAADADVAVWKQRGYEAKSFEIGAVFGVEGDVIDSREVYLGVAPEADEAAAQRAARALAAKWHVETFVHPEMVARPEGTLVATGGGAVVRNAGVVWFAPAAPGPGATLTVRDVVHGGGGAQLGAEKRETRAYRGRVYVTVGADGALTVVNAIPEDELLAGIVPSEIWPDAPADAVRAQAVAARAEVLSKVGTRHFLDPFLLCSSQHCQVYGGVSLEDKRTTQAIADTRGEVLLRDGGGGLVEAAYSSDCGGFGEHNENVWGAPPDPSLRGRLDALGADARALGSFAGGITEANLRAFLDSPAERTFCGRTRYAKKSHRWTVVRTAAELDRLVAAEHPQVGSVRDLKALARGVSGRVTRLQIAGERGTVVVDGELKIRRLLGGLKSSLFAVRAEAGGWRFDGAGFGHGVGMCQTGAVGMAETGFAYQKILEHYYPGSHLRKLY